MFSAHVQVSPPMTDLVTRLRAAGSVFAEDEAQLLTDAATGGPLEALVQRRIAGEPLEVVVGWAEFCGLRITIDPGVFVPRHRTEFLVQVAASLVQPGATALDLCCGSGALGAALASIVDVDLYAADIDPVAVACARKNVARVYEGDLFDPLPAVLFDVILCNTPYVPSAEIAMLPPEARDWEAPVALDGGDDGLDVQRRVAASVGHWLVPGGSVLVEASAEQAPVSVAIFEAAGLSARIEYSDEYETSVVVATLR
jgi:release factor glutamine methyltransferase